MAILVLTWDNTAILAGTPNALAVRASKRIKAIGGAFSTLGFSPANDMAISIISTEATVLVNRVYEFKVETICSSGGPAINNNGLVEGIVFECVEPTFIVGASTIEVELDLATTDITKARLTLRKQSDNSLAGGPVIVNKVADAVNHTFIGLEPGTDYYLTVELYAVVNGIEVISSGASESIGGVCGGNTSGYQASTNPCIGYNIDIPAEGLELEWTDCSSAEIVSQTFPPAAPFTFSLCSLTIPVGADVSSQFDCECESYTNNSGVPITNVHYKDCVTGEQITGATIDDEETICVKAGTLNTNEASSDLTPDGIGSC